MAEKKIMIYDKLRKCAYYGSDIKALSEVTNVKADLIKAYKDDGLETDKFIIGPIEWVKSNRGGARKANRGSFAKKGEDKTW